MSELLAVGTLIVLAVVVLWVIVAAAVQGQSDYQYTVQHGFEMPTFGPELDVDVTVGSFSEPGVTYTVNVEQLTCTCPDWRIRRSHHEGRDAGRLCKHLAQLWQEALGDRLDTLTRLVVQMAVHKGAPVQYHRLLDEKRQRLAIIAGSGQDWVNVAAYWEPRPGSRKDVEVAFGYSTVEGRWAYGEKPKGLPGIEELIGRFRADGLV